MQENTGPDRRFRDALAKGEIALPKCENCGSFHFFPRVVCPHCHETYMTAETAEELERLIQQRKELARPETVDAIQFAHA